MCDEAVVGLGLFFCELDGTKVERLDELVASQPPRDKHGAPGHAADVLSEWLSLATGRPPGTARRY